MCGWVLFDCNYLNCTHHQFYDFGCLENHMNLNHSSRKPEVCVTCGETFWEPERLANHYTEEHPVPNILCQNLSLDNNNPPEEYPILRSTLDSPDHCDSDSESSNDMSNVNIFTNDIINREIKAEQQSDSIHSFNDITRPSTSFAFDDPENINLNKKIHFPNLTVVVLSMGTILFHFGYNQTKEYELPEDILCYFDKEFSEMSIKSMSSEIDKIVYKFRK